MHIEMNQTLSYLIIGIICVLLIDTIGAFLSKQFSFNYKSLSVLSFMVYAVIGFLVGQESSLIYVVIVCMALGFFDATIGWKLSWVIGPGKLPPEYSNKSYIIRAIVTVSFLAGTIGYIAAMSAR